MSQCSLCGKEDLCFTCQYCGGIYCAEHRLPESHGCPGLQRARDDARRKIADSFSGQYEEEVETQRTWLQPKKKPKAKRPMKRKKFSAQERRDLAIASVLVILVGISMMGNNILSALFNLVTILAIGLWWYPVLTIGIFLVSFMAHEMAHKFAAQHYGMWSEFRMTPAGYYLSAIAILFSFPVFGTGVVLSVGSPTQEEDAKTNLAGPFCNFVIAAILAAIAIIFSFASSGLVFPLDYALRHGIALNAMLGLFNMIPFQPLDGATVIAWNKAIWAVQVLALLSLLLFGYFGISLL